MVEECASRSRAATTTVAVVEEGGEGKEGGEEDEEEARAFFSSFSFLSCSLLLLPLHRASEATEARAAPTKSCKRRVIQGKRR